MVNEEREKEKLERVRSKERDREGGRDREGDREDRR